MEAQSAPPPFYSRSLSGASSPAPASSSASPHPTATSSPVPSPASSPFALHRAGLREARRALDARLQAEGGGAAALGAQEWAAWARCRQLGVPLAAAPGSVAVAAVAFAAASAARRAPHSAAARALLESRASLAATAGLLVFNHQTSPASALSERCYVHALAGASEAGAEMRAAYRAAAGDNAFLGAAESVARAQEGLPPRPAAGAGGAPPSMTTTATPARYPRTDFADRLQAVMQFAPAPTPTRGLPAVLPRPAAQAQPGPRAQALETSNDGYADERELQRGFDEAPAPLGAAAVSVAPASRRSTSGATRKEAAPRWSVDFGEEDESLSPEASAARAAAAARDAAVATAAAVAAARDTEPSWAARARRRDALFSGGRGSGGGAGGGAGGGDLA